MSCSAASVVPQLSRFGLVPASGNEVTAFADVTPNADVTVMAFCNNAATLTLRWSMDGLNADFTEATTIAAGTAVSVFKPVRSKFVALTIAAGSGDTIRYQTIFHAAPPGVSALTNLGSGAELFVPASSGIRSLQSSDASITVTQNAADVDLVAASPSPTGNYFMRGFGAGNSQTFESTENSTHRIGQSFTAYTTTAVGDFSSGTGVEIDSDAVQTILVTLTINLDPKGDRIMFWLGMGSSAVYNEMKVETDMVDSSGDIGCLTLTGVVTTGASNSLRIYMKRTSGGTTVTHTFYSIMYTGVTIA
jgi:hypothetical protein